MLDKALSLLGTAPKEDNNIKGLLLVKLGGLPAIDRQTTAALADELHSMIGKGQLAILVHGGGTVISEIQRRYGMKPCFVDGLRHTPPEEMPLIDMALAGRVNKELVRFLWSRGLRPWGLSGVDGGLSIAESLSGDGDSKNNRSGHLTVLDSKPLKLLLDHGFLPVLAPPSTDAQGQGINVNADEMALAVAVALRAERLIFLSDVPGLMEKGKILPSINREMAQAKEAAGVITGGMIPKVRSAFEALRQGVRGVSIGEYREPGDLTRLMNQSKGTLLTEG